jgi:uncharacterized protein (TIGR02246 family)
MQSDEQAIRNVIRTWIDATKVGDIDRVLSLMSDDAVFLTVGQQPFGKDAFAAASRAGQGKVAIDATPDIREVTICGDMAYTINHLTVNVTPTQGDPRQMAGFILTVFRKQPDGRWLLVRDANLLTPQTPPRALKSAVPVLQVASVARSMAWYHDVAGFAADPFGPPDEPVFAILNREGVELMLQRQQGPARPAGEGWSVYLRVADVNALHAAIKSKVPDVAAIQDRVYGCREFTLGDPDGHVIVFGQCG